ncbi:uncharacterized protein N7483_003040, partial [Penicillium malachiteum]|uniref:uncharacterized protein n=1 Tax=Penicillium malachiteum TaxID=1324776 RepID=UPI002546A6D4
YYEQSTTNIWSCICEAVKESIQKSGIPRSNIRGFEFDATCSLAVFSKESGTPVSVSGSELSNDQNVILWLDPRAVEETNTINATGHPVLKYVGSAMSVEMEIPKILWLKNNLDPRKFRDCKFYDLMDALTHLATGQETRSYCSAICKQGYLASGVDSREEGWQLDFLSSIGLQDLAEDNFSGLGGIHGNNGKYLSAGQCVGPLSERAAGELGMSPGIAVGSGVIDAYAGWIGRVGANVDLGLGSSADQKGDVSHRLAVVAGTSTCHLAISNKELFVPGVWGPYRDFLFLGAYLAEGGQSATGELIRYIVEGHPAYSGTGGIHVYDFLNDYLLKEAKRTDAASVALVGKHFFFYGDLWGNRSPIADPQMSGAVIGLKSDKSIHDLALHYYGTLEFIALQTRQIYYERIRRSNLVNLHTQNDLLVHLIASICRMPIVVPEYLHAAVCHGSAMLAAMAASDASGTGSKNLWEIISQMSKPGRLVKPTTDMQEERLLQTKYDIFLEMSLKQREYRARINKQVN